MGINSGKTCCCKFGYAIAGEWPEFPCPGCERHDGNLDPQDLCKRHKDQKESLAIRAAKVWKYEHAPITHGGRMGKDIEIKLDEMRRQERFDEDYDEIDYLIDNDPIELGRLCRKFIRENKRLRAIIREAWDESNGV